MAALATIIFAGQANAAPTKSLIGELLQPLRELGEAPLKPPRNVGPRRDSARSPGGGGSFFDQLATMLSPTRDFVSDPTGERPGTVVVDTQAKHLYLVLGDGQALRYSIGVGREGFAWKGVTSVGRKAEWPDWRPPAPMLARQPHLPRYMPGGINNPLGARALYLHAGGADTMFRIHGTNDAKSIGRAVSSGCIRLMNDDVVDLYGRVRIGTRVIVR